MEKYTHNYAAHLENIRQEYKITQEDFCEGVCSTRNYHRYLSGQIVLPFSKILLFCDKLGISPTDFYTSFYKNTDVEFKKLIQLYDLLRERKLTEFYKLLPSIQVNRISNKQNKKLYYFCVEAAKYYSNKSVISHAYEEISKIIDYPNCLSRKFFDFVDIITLVLISEIEIKLKSNKSINLLIKILDDNTSMLIGQNITHLLPGIYANIALALGKLGRFDDCLNITNKGIEFSLSRNNYSYIVMLRYLKFICLLKLDFREKAEIEAAKCVASSITTESQYFSDTYYQLIKKDLNIEPIDLILKYQKELLNLDK